MTSRKKVPVSTFGHVSSPHSRDASVHQLLRKYLYPIRSYWHFPKSKTATAAILDFQFMCIWPFRRVDRAVFVFCTKFGSNICYSHRDRRTYASDLNLMTSRELTSGFDFWSHHHMVISASPWCIFPYNLTQDIIIQSKVIDIFRNSRWRPPPSWIFSLCEFGHSGVLVVWYLCSVPNLVQISVIVTEIDAYLLQTFIWWRHAN